MRKHVRQYCHALFSCTVRSASGRCSALQHAATHCNTPQHDSTHCNSLQHARHPRTHLVLLHARARLILMHCQEFFRTRGQKSRKKSKRNRVIRYLHSKRSVCCSVCCSLCCSVLKRVNAAQLRRQIFTY